MRSAKFDLSTSAGRASYAAETVRMIYSNASGDGKLDDQQRAMVDKKISQYGTSVLEDPNNPGSSIAQQYPWAPESHKSLSSL
jgi:hypothetical protein